MTGWYFKSDETECGPYSLDELIYLKNKGQITPGSLVKNEHQSGWVRAESVRELFSKERLTHSRIELATLIKPNAVKEESDISSEIVDFIDETPDKTNLPPLPAEHRNRSQKNVIFSVLAGGLLLLLLLLLILFYGKTQPSRRQLPDQHPHKARERECQANKAQKERQGPVILCRHLQNRKRAETVW
ncbi:DUF4339 domain-containing protein [Gimesia benthica]